MLNLADMIFIATQVLTEEERPSEGFGTTAWNFLKNYTASGKGKRVATEAPWESPSLNIDYTSLAALGRPIVDLDTFTVAMRRYAPLRSNLIAKCIEDGWRREFE